MSAIYDLTIEQGADFELTMTVLSEGSAMNLTGYSARSQVRRNYQSVEPDVSLTSDTDGGITLGGSLGTLTLEIPAADTEVLTAGKYVWDLELVSPSGKVTRLLQGACLVTAEVTR